ncbi:MAG: Mth938-like domain-containing protein [Candidatus Thorarchaeota archaeon]
MRIDDYRFGSIVVDGREYRNDVIIFPDHVESDWWRKSGHELCVEDLASVLDFGPRTLIVGTGYNGRMKVLDQTTDRMKQIDCEIVERGTREACEVYNTRRDEYGIIACLHLTC